MKTDLPSTRIKAILSELFPYGQHTASDLFITVCAYLDEQHQAIQRGNDLIRSMGADMPPQPVQLAEMIYCAFCGLSPPKVKRLIAGPSVYVCDGCVRLLSEIVDEEQAKEAGETSDG